MGFTYMPTETCLTLTKTKILTMSRKFRIRSITRGEGLSLGGKLWLNSKPNVLKFVHRSDLLRRIIDPFKYSEACSEVPVLG